jgi:manganese oxidase
MDGVGGLTQKVIPPGETFVYEFPIRQHGTHMYHSHHDEMTQMAMGLMGVFVMHREDQSAESIAISRFCSLNGASILALIVQTPTR